MTRTSTLLFVVFATLAPSFVDGYRHAGPVLNKLQNRNKDSAVASRAEQNASGEPCLQPSPSDLPEGSWCADFQYTKTCFVNEEYCWPVSDEAVDEIVSNALKHAQPNQQKHTIVLAGGMAAGKSTAFEYVTSQMGVDPESFVSGGFDDVRKALPQYKSHMENRDQFAPMSNGNAQPGEKRDHMVGLMGECRDVIRPATLKIAAEASKRGLDVVSEGFDGIAKIAMFAEMCYDISLVTVKNNADEAVCRALERQDEEQRFKDIPGVRATYNNVEKDFEKTRSMLLELFSEEGYYNSFAKPPHHVKMCNGAKFHIFNCDNTGDSMTCADSMSLAEDRFGNPAGLNEDWTQVWQAYQTSLG